jgi:hypothetical protein
MRDFHDLLTKAEILCERAAEVGKLTYDEALTIAEIRKLDKEQGGQLSPEREAELITLTSTLTQKLFPENIESIMKRKSTYYTTMML